MEPEPLDDWVPSEEEVYESDFDATPDLTAPAGHQARLPPLPRDPSFAAVACSPARRADAVSAQGGAAPGAGRLAQGRFAGAPAEAAELAQANSPPDAGPPTPADSYAVEHDAEAGAAPVSEASSSYSEHLPAAYWPPDAGVELPAHSGEAADTGAPAPLSAHGRTGAAEPQDAWDPGPDPSAEDRDLVDFLGSVALEQGGAADLEDTEYVLDEEDCASQLGLHAETQRPAQGLRPRALDEQGRALQLPAQEQALQGFGHTAGLAGAHSLGPGGAREPSEEVGDGADSDGQPESLASGGGMFVFGGGGSREAGAAAPNLAPNLSFRGSSEDMLYSLEVGGSTPGVSGADGSEAAGAPPQPSRRSSCGASSGSGYANEALTVRDGMLVFGADEHGAAQAPLVLHSGRGSRQASSASSWRSSRRRSSGLPGLQAAARVSTSGPEHWQAGSPGADPHWEEDAHDSPLSAAGLDRPHQTLAPSGRLSRSGHPAPQEAPGPAVEHAGDAGSQGGAATAAPVHGESARRASGEARVAGWPGATDPGPSPSGAEGTGFGQAGAQRLQGDALRAEGCAHPMLLAARPAEGAGQGPRAGAGLHRRASAGSDRAPPHAPAARARRSATDPRTMPWVDPDPVPLRQAAPGPPAGLARGEVSWREAAHAQLPGGEGPWRGAQQAEHPQARPGSALDLLPVHVSASDAPGPQGAEHTISAAHAATAAPQGADPYPDEGRDLRHSASARRPRPQSAAPGKRRATAAPLRGPWEAPARAAPAPASAQALSTPSGPWPAALAPEADQAGAGWWAQAQAAGPGQEALQSAKSADSQHQHSAEAPARRALGQSVSARQARPRSAAPGKRRATAAPQSIPWQAPWIQPLDLAHASKQPVDEAAAQRGSEARQPGDEQASSWAYVEREQAAADEAAGSGAGPAPEASAPRPGDQGGTANAEWAAAQLGSQGAAYAGLHAADEDAAVELAEHAGQASAAPPQRRARGRSELRPPDPRAAAPRARRASAFANPSLDPAPGGPRHAFPDALRRPAPLALQRPARAALAEEVLGEGRMDPGEEPEEWSHRSASGGGTHTMEAADAEGPGACGSDVPSWDDAPRPWGQGAGAGPGSVGSAAASGAGSRQDGEDDERMPDQRGSADSDWDHGSAQPPHPDADSGPAAPAIAASLQQQQQQGSHGGFAIAGAVAASPAGTQAPSRPRVRSLASMQGARPQSAGALPRRASAAPRSPAWHAPRQQLSAAPPRTAATHAWVAQDSMAAEEAQGGLAVESVEAPGAGTAMRPRLASVGSAGLDAGFGSGAGYQAARPHTAAPGPAHRRPNPAHFPDLQLAAEGSHAGVAATAPHEHAQGQQAEQMARGERVSAKRLTLVHAQRPASPQPLAQRAPGPETLHPEGRPPQRRHGSAPAQRPRAGGAQPMGGGPSCVTAAAARAERLARSVAAQMARPAVEWGVAEVCDWVEHAGLGQYRQRCLHQCVAGRLLLALTDAQLKACRIELGIAPMGHREGLLRAIADLRATQDARHGTSSGTLALEPCQGRAMRQRPASAGSACGRRPGGGAWGGGGLGDDSEGLGPRGALAAERQRTRILHEMERTQARAAQKRTAISDAERHAQLAQEELRALGGQLAALERRFRLPAAAPAHAGIPRPAGSGGAKQPGLDAAGAVPWQPSGIAALPLDVPASPTSSPARSTASPARTRASASSFMARLELDLATRKQRLALDLAMRATVPCNLAPTLEPSRAAAWLAARRNGSEAGLGLGLGEHGQPRAAAADPLIGDADAALQHLLGREAPAGHGAPGALQAAAGLGSGGVTGVGAAIDEALDRCAAELGIPAEKVEHVRALPPAPKAARVAAAIRTAQFMERWRADMETRSGRLRALEMHWHEVEMRSGAVAPDSRAARFCRPPPTPEQRAAATEAAAAAFFASLGWGPAETGGGTCVAALLARAAVLQEHRARAAAAAPGARLAMEASAPAPVKDGLDALQAAAVAQAQLPPASAAAEAAAKPGSAAAAPAKLAGAEPTPLQACSIRVTVGLLAAARPDELARLSAAATGPRQALALFRCVQEQRFVAYMREADERRQAKLAAALAAASPARRQRSREDQEAFYARLLDDTSRRRIKREELVKKAAEAEVAKQREAQEKLAYQLGLSAKGRRSVRPASAR